jgi:hypothetical protein
MPGSMFADPRRLTLNSTVLGYELPVTNYRGSILTFRRTKIPVTILRMLDYKHSIPHSEKCGVEFTIKIAFFTKRQLTKPFSESTPIVIAYMGGVLPRSCIGGF